MDQRISATPEPTRKQENCSLAAVQVCVSSAGCRQTTDAQLMWFVWGANLAPIAPIAWRMQKSCTLSSSMGLKSTCISRLALTLLCRQLKQGVCCSCSTNAAVQCI